MGAPSELVIAVAAPRRGLRREDAARYVGLSPTKFDALVADGRMPKAKRIDGCVVWDIRKLDAAFDDLPDGEVENDPWEVLRRARQRA